MRWTDVRCGRLLDGCTLSVPVGTRLLLVSEPEAAGSVLIRILAGLSRPDRGDVEIAGLRDGEWGARVAHVGPGASLPEWMTPREALGLAARLIGLPRADAARRTERAVAWTRISTEEIDRPMRRGGPPLVQRTAFASALLGDPEVLLLDEPLRAIEARERTRLLHLPGRRRTIIMASRYPSSEDGLASHVALVRTGRIELVARVDELAAARLPLSHRGVTALAERRAAVREAPPARTTPAASVP